MSQSIIHFYKFDDFLVDVDGRSLFRNGTPVPIKPKAFEALLVLIEHRGQVVSKEKLMDALWPEADVEPNNVDQQIAVLRTVLGGQFRNRERYIRTIRGQGFRFIADVRSMTAPEPPNAQPLSVTAVSSAQWKSILIAALISALVASSLTATIFYFLRRSERIANYASTIKPLVKASADGSWMAIVPPIAEGVPIEADGHPFELSVGDEIEVVVSGISDIGRGPVGPDGEDGSPPYRDSTVDSKFKDHVGGLEMWIGPDKNANRYFIGSHFIGKVGHTGTPTFRAIESLPGYNDGNSGAFTVTVRKLVPSAK